MLSAYFDDSGTHDGSAVVVMGGLIGSEAQWSAFETRWRARLQDPVEGMRPPLRQFHMYDCQHSLDEFEGWTRTESDYLVHQLQTIILEESLVGYAAAVARADWDDLITGVSREVSGDAEGFCIRNCLVRTLDWARDRTTEPEVAFIFDNRPHRQASNERVHRVFATVAELDTVPPSLAPIAFVSAATHLPLQAADMFAWEVYQQAKAFVTEGTVELQREPFARLVETGRFNCEIVTRPQILKLVEMQKARDPLHVKSMADYLKR